MASSPPTPPQVSPSDLVEIANQRVAKVLAHPLRVMILAALNEQAMSPRMYYELYGGASLQMVAQHFAVLLRLGCVELIDVRRPATRRRGASEHVYRATRRIAFDQEALEALGSEKRGVTWAIFVSLVRRLGAAFQASTFGARSDAHFSWTVCLLDEPAWTAVLYAVDALFWRSLELQADASLRLAISGEKPIWVTTALSCFPNGDDPPDHPFPHDPTLRPELEGTEQSARAARESLAKLLAHPIRQRIVAVLGVQPMGPGQFHKLYGGGLAFTSILYHFGLLEDLGRIEMQHERSGRGRREGGVERVYRTTRRALVDAQAYDAMPPTLRAEIDSIAVLTYLDTLAEAIRSDAIESRPSGHLTWTGFKLDLQGWTELVAATDAVFRYIFLAERQAIDRCTKKGQRPMPVVVGLSCFEAPPNSWVVAGGEMAELWGKITPEKRQKLRTYLTRIIDGVAD